MSKLTSFSPFRVSAANPKKEPKNDMTFQEIKTNEIFDSILKGSPYSPYQNLPVREGKGQTDIVMRTSDSNELHIPVTTYPTTENLKEFNSLERFYYSDSNNRTINTVLILVIEEKEGRKYFDQKYDPELVRVRDTGFKRTEPLFIISKMPIEGDQLKLTENSTSELRNLNDLLTNGVATGYESGNNRFRWMIPGHPAPALQVAPPKKRTTYTTITDMVNSLFSLSLSPATANVRTSNKNVNTSSQKKTDALTDLNNFPTIPYRSDETVIITNETFENIF